MNKIDYFRKALLSRAQRFQSDHYENTAFGRRIKRLCNSHEGERCIIVGNGPSLTTADLDRITESRIPSFGMNRIFNIFPETSWRPTYYVSEDILILKDIQETVSSIPSMKFIPINLKWFEGVDIRDAVYFYMDYRSELGDSYGLSLDAAHCLRCRGTVTTTCIQLAIYMGFSDIYLLGIDHNYSKKIDEDGNIVEDHSVKDYFAEGYDSDIRDQVVHDMREPTRAFASVEQLSRKLKTFRVFNATRGGRLEVFERVNFDSLF